MEKALREAGARVVAAGYLESGLYTTVHPDLSAAAAVPVLSFASDQRLWQISSMRIVVPAGEIQCDDPIAINHDIVHSEITMN